MNITTRRILHSEWRGPLLCLQTNCLEQSPLYLLWCFHIRINMDYTLFYYYYPIYNFLPGCECMLNACLVLVSTPACMCLEVRGGWQVSSSVTFHFSFWDKDSYWTSSSLFWLDLLASKSLEFTCFYSLAVDRHVPLWQPCLIVSGFYWGDGNLSLVPMFVEQALLPSEPSLWPLICNFLSKLRNHRIW